MTNEEYLREYATARELASALVCCEEINELDENFDGEYSDYFVTCYKSPDGNSYYDLEDAIERTMQWLSAER